MADYSIESLYASFKDDARGWLGLHRQHFTQFVSIILAVLTASLAALYHLRNEALLLLLVSLGPALNIILCVLAVRVCDKFYLRYWEHETVSYKLFGLMEDAHKISARIQERKGIFPADSHLFPRRWLDRVAEYDTSKSFTESRLTARNSSNWYIRITFWVLIGISAVIGVAMLTTAFVNLLKTGHS